MISNNFDDFKDGFSSEDWRDIVEAGEVDPILRLAARDGVIGNEFSISCTIFRKKDDGSYFELCDGFVLFSGKCREVDDAWSHVYEELYSEYDEERLLYAWLEVVDDGKPEPPDVISVEVGCGFCIPYELVDFREDERGCRCILFNVNG